MSLTLLQEFTRRTGIRDGKVDAILIAQAALPKFSHGIQLPRSNARDWMMTTIAPPQAPPQAPPINLYQYWRALITQRKVHWGNYVSLDLGKDDLPDSITAPIRATDDEIRRMIDELIEGHHTGDMPCEC